MEQGNQNPLEKNSDNIFFNVMPNASKGPFVESITNNNSGSSAVSSKRKLVKILIILLAIAALAVGAYFGFTYWQKHKDTKNNPQNTNSQTPASNKTEDTNPVTTSPEWLQQYFNTQTCEEINTCGDNSDPDNDGLKNKGEEQFKTDPNKADTDQDGLADGDEVHIFGGDPTNIKTSGNDQYTDSDDAKGGYDSTQKGQALTPERLAEIANNIKQIGLHEPTLTTLGTFLQKYQITDPSPTPTATPSVAESSNNADNSPEAQLSRDTERLATMQKLGVALYKFYTDTGFYPVSTAFNEMLSKIKPYNMVATNTTDPLNKDPFIYTYTAMLDGKDFTLTYYSETQKQLIKYTSANAIKDSELQVASLNDDQRMRDLETLRQALLIYSAANTAGSQVYVFPTQAKYKTDLVPQFLQEIPKDPKTTQDYVYTVSKTFDSFTLKTALEHPPTGKTGYQCTQDACDNY